MGAVCCTLIYLLLCEAESRSDKSGRCVGKFYHGLKMLVHLLWQVKGAQPYVSQRGMCGLLCSPWFKWLSLSPSLPLSCLWVVCLSGLTPDPPPNCPGYVSVLRLLNVLVNLLTAVQTQHLLLPSFEREPGDLCSSPSSC